MLSFDAVQARRGAYARSDRGVHTVEVSRIRGSVGRAAALGKGFLPRHGSWGSTGATSDRLRRLEVLFDEGGVPPLELYRIEDDYFVVDGHHRVAVALRRGQEFLEARVVEYMPDRTDPVTLLRGERRAFEAETGLRSVAATEMGRYPRLLNRVRDHWQDLVEEGPPAIEERAAFGPREPTADRGRDLRWAAADWHEREYRPVVQALSGARVLDRFPERGSGDVYGYVGDHRWYMSEHRGADVGVDAALGDFLRHHAPSAIAALLLPGSAGAAPRGLALAKLVGRLRLALGGPDAALDAAAARA